MAKLYRQELSLHATAYIRAESPEEAARIVAARFGEPHSGGELPIGEGVDIIISGRAFDDPRLPDVSLSPAVTFGELTGAPVDADE